MAMTRRLARTLALAAGGGVASVLAACAGVGYFVAHRLTAPNPSTYMDDFTMTPFETGVPFERVRIPARTTDRSLVGWWFPRPETDRVLIGCTGYRGSKSDLIGIGSALWRAGYNILLFDYHGHGSAHGAPVTLAYRELQDFFAALAYVQRRLPGGRIGVFGFSMGAAIAILGAAERPEVRAVLADSSFASHTAVVRHAVEQTIHLPGAPFTAIADYFLARRAGYRGRDVAPERVIARIAPRPVLLIHGTDDEMIPVTHAYRLFEAAREPKDLWIAPAANHCGAYFIDRPAYCERAAAFFDAALAETCEETVEAAR
ncbi:MAG TPA: alpha/beta fold hydrolase [Ktedonobacterales bacterium]